jgi:hypothetical protein
MLPIEKKHRNLSQDSLFCIDVNFENFTDDSFCPIEKKYRNLSQDSLFCIDVNYGNFTEDSFCPVEKSTEILVWIACGPLRELQKPQSG